MTITAEQAELLLDSGSANYCGNDLARALIASEAARKLAEERLVKAVEALRELAIHPEDNGDIMPGDFRDYYRDTCDFAAKALKEIDNG